MRNKILNYFEYKLGVNDLRNRLDTMYYFLNEFVDITNIPPTKNQDLRKMQECDSILLAIFDKLCKKHGLTYWLTYGTLLGAVRHKGFIPWDDDMDVAMLREDYYKLEDIIRKELVPLGIELYPRPTGPTLGIGYKHFDTGIWLDVFPVDIVTSSKKLVDVQNDLKMKIKRYQNFYFEKKNSGLKNRDFDSCRCSLLNVEGNEKIICHCLEYSPDDVFLFEDQDIFPLANMRFEDYSFPVPNQYHHYLEVMYGDYLCFPKSGILIHDAGRGHLHTWAKKSGTNMIEIKDNLNSILNCYN